MTSQRTVYVVVWDDGKGNGGFEWCSDAGDALAVQELCEKWVRVKGAEARSVRFPWQCDIGTSDEDLHDKVEAEYNVSGFLGRLYPEVYETPLVDPRTVA